MSARNGRREPRPSFQFYPQDFLSSPKVRRMTAAARGAYITLLSDQWLEGSLPADPQDLADRAGMALEEFQREWAGPLGRCFELRADGRLVNERLERERGLAEERSRRLAESGAKGGRTRREAPPSEGLAENGQAEGSPSPAEASPQPGLAGAKPSGKGREGKGRDTLSGVGVQGENPGPEAPDESAPQAPRSGLPALERALQGRLDLPERITGALRDWAQHRDEQGKPLTSTAIRRLILAAGRDPGGLLARLDASTESGTTALMDTRGSGHSARHSAHGARQHGIQALEQFLHEQFPDQKRL